MEFNPPKTDGTGFNRKELFKATSLLKDAGWKLTEQKLRNEEEINLKEEKRLDEQDKKRMNGSVKWFNGSKGYGFITSEDDGKDIFVHSSAVKNAGFKYLQEGDQLTFEIEKTDKGSSAINLQKKF